MILNGDCLELMKTLPDKSVDCFICDLPYGCFTPKDSNINWDIKLNFEEFWVQIKRLRKNDHTPCIMFCNAMFGAEMIMSNQKEFRYDLIWEKSCGVGFLNSNKQPLRFHELIYIFSKKGAFYNKIDIEVEGAKGYETKLEIINGNCYGKKIKSPCIRLEGFRCAKSIITSKSIKHKGQHPTEKPIDLYKFLIERYSNEGDTILDPTFGSGNSGLASRELKRKYIGIEKDETFFKKFENIWNVVIENEN